MQKTEFLRRQSELIRLIDEELNKSGLTENQIDSLKRIKNILNEHTYENRMMKKGVISYTIVDSLELDNSISDRLILFDKYL